MTSTAWPKGSVKDVAESLGIASLSDEAATALAADVEYRLREVLETSLIFARHAKRSRLKIEDVDYALKARNIEPLWGFSSTHAPLAYRKAAHGSGNLYYIDDDEIDLSRLSQSALPPVPREISYTAHWLAVEGVQPAIPQNPSPADVRAASASARSATRVAAAGPEGTQVKPLVAHALSKELQLYFDRLTSAAVDQDETMRAAALESFRGDTGLQGLVAYLVQWVAERVVASLNSSLPALDQCLDIFEAMLQNKSLFIEPYLHQILPPVLSILLTSSLGPSSSSLAAAQQAGGLTPSALRQHASSFLSFLLQRYGSSYAALKPRILQTVLRGLVSGCSSLSSSSSSSSSSALDVRHAGSSGITGGSSSTASGTVLGAVLGIHALGRDSTRKVFGARSPNLGKLGEALQRDSFPEHEREACTAAALDALQSAYPDDPAAQTFDYSDLEATVGRYFAGYINQRCTPSVPRGVLADLAIVSNSVEGSDADQGSRERSSGERRAVRTSRDASMDASESGADGNGDDEDEDEDDIDMENVNV